MNNRGKLIILSGPSGVGKDTLLKKLVEINKNIKISVSATTRPQRNYEKNGEDYYFIDKIEFLKMVQNDEMLEYANYCEYFYGTPKHFVDKSLDDGIDVILEIETDGALKVMEKCQDAVSIFVLPPSLEELQKRLALRASEDEVTILKRLEKAKQEMERVKNYKHIVVNDDLEKCANSINFIINSEHVNEFDGEIVEKEVLKNVKEFS